jgi:hypothetical protein
MSTMNPQTPTIDDIAAALPPIAQALTTIADALEAVVDVACRATVLPEHVADHLNDAGQRLIAYSRTIMHEEHERSRTGSRRDAPPLQPNPADPAIGISAEPELPPAAQA